MWRTSLPPFAAGPGTFRDANKARLTPLGDLGFSNLVSFLELSVLLKDVLMRGTSGRYVWVVVSAQDIRSAF